MAIQQGVIPLSGKIGDVVFSNRKGKRYAKAKSNKPINQTVDTIKSSTDFGAASRLGARVRTAFSPLINKYGDSVLVSRFTKQILKVFKTIPKNYLGVKQFSDGDVSIFQDFQFNSSIAQSSLLRELPRIKLQPSGLAIAFKEKHVTDLIKWVPKAAFAVIQLMVYNLKLDGGEDEVFCSKELVISAESELFRGAKLQVPLTLKGEQVLWVAVGIHYLGSNKNFIGNKTQRAAAVVDIKRISDGAEVVFVQEPRLAAAEEADEGNLAWEII